MLELEIIKSAISNGERFGQLLEYPADALFETSNACRIYTALESIHKKDLHPSLSTIREILISQGMQESEAKQLILELDTSYPEPNFSFAIQTAFNLRKESRAKSFIESLFADIGRMTYEDIERKCGEFFSDGTLGRTEHSITVKELAEMPLDDIFKSQPYIQTGITKLDAMITGLFTGQLIVIAARPGQGKSSLALQIACNIQKPVLFFSLEMGARELWARMLSSVAEIESWRIETATLSDGKRNELNALIEAQESFKTSQLTIFDKVSNFDAILRIMKKHARSGNLGLVAIDYLQRISGMYGDNKNLEIQNTTNALKDFAREYDIPVILLSQLNRAVEVRSDPRPTLADLRDSGAIEQDADVIIFLYENMGRNLIYVAKNRKGKCVEDEIYFQKQFTRFVA